MQDAVQLCCPRLRELPSVLHANRNRARSQHSGRRRMRAGRGTGVRSYHALRRSCALSKATSRRRRRNLLGGIATRKGDTAVRPGRDITQLGGSAVPTAQGDGIGDRRCRGASSGVTSFALTPASMALVASNRTTWPWPFRRAMSIGVSPRQVASAGAPALNNAATTTPYLPGNPCASASAGLYREDDHPRRPSASPWTRRRPPRSPSCRDPS